MPEKLLIDPPPPEIIEGRKRLVTPEALADYLQCRTTFLRREVKAGRLRGIWLTETELRFRWEDVDEWIRSREGLVS
jgi:hypothetical protein